MENNPHWTDMLLTHPAIAREYIIEESMDWWICRCGNKPNHEGFYSCSEIGERCEPSIGEWDGKHWLCERCYRIINGDTLEVVGTCSQDVFNKNEEYRWQAL